jgi:hypothetical protein
MSSEASMSAMIYGRRFGQLEAVLPRGCGRCGGTYFCAVVVARTGVVVEGLGIAWPLALAVTAARALDVFGEYGGGKRGRVEHGLLVETLRDAGSLRHGLVAGARPLPLELYVDSGLEVVEREVLPSVLDLDIGQSEAVLQRPGHLQIQD